MPHLETKCPHCKKDFAIDLLWEDNPNSIGHRFINNKGKSIPYQLAKEHPENVSKEVSENIIDCPFCQYSWNAFFEQNRDSGEIETVNALDNPQSTPKALSAN